ncbi:protein of unknown function [Candidatus Nitrosocosmicus franklandus]|uniref:Uncharacterized protein n=1 Tax=Candidatus Nitrosocosmicus franklandianus TaxID=1798806 RepID=A0A484I403_9ARCH|nr:protein of unknown function [Candidatus Nitrosocosmicus franklandus]
MGKKKLFQFIQRSRKKSIPLVDFILTIDLFKTFKPNPVN